MPANLLSLATIFDELFPTPAKAKCQKDRSTADNNNQQGNTCPADKNILHHEFRPINFC